MAYPLLSAAKDLLDHSLLWPVIDTNIIHI